MIKEGKFTILETRGAVAKLTIDRPEKRNALSRDAIREVLAVFEELRNDDEIAVVLTTGAGDVAFAPAAIYPNSRPKAGRTAAKTAARSRAPIMSRR